MKITAARAWRWLTGRVTMRPRRVTAIFWLWYVVFLPQINHLCDRYRTPIRQVDNWALLALIPVALILLGVYGRAWYSGRDARRKRKAGNGA